MKAAVLKGIKDIEIQDLRMPEVKEGSLLLEVISCAVCGSDVRIYESGNPRVKYPAVIGHEISGNVVEAGKGVTSFKKGDRLAIGADVPCGRCEWCLNGMGNCCDINYAMGYQFHGGFAEYCLLDPLVVKYGPVCKVPEGVDMDHAALAEPLACCINGLERVFFEKGKTVLVIGAGPIGLLLIQTARAFGSDCIILSDIDSKRLKISEKFNPDYIINTKEESLCDKVMSITKGKGADVVITACPSPDAHEDALKVTAKRGFINFFGGLPKDSRNISISSNDIHYKEIYITGSHGSVPRQHELAINLVASGRINVSDLITHKFLLNEIEKALSTVKNKEGLKVIVKPKEA
ncbi:alcohol dehydrogenase catalytic domain-containing protein [bacterium]